MSSNAQVNKFLAEVENSRLSIKLKEIISWIETTYPNFKLEYKWNQPMLTKNGTYIMGFSVSKKHLSVGLEDIVMKHFQDKLDQLGIEHGKMIFKIKENEMVNYDLIKELIDYIVDLKREDVTFWHRG